MTSAVILFPLLALTVAGTPPDSSDGAIALPEPLLEVPLVRHSGQALVEVQVDGRGPFHFTVDTGAALSACVDVALVERLDLPAVGRRDNADGSGRVIERDVVTVASIRLGDLVFEDVEAIAADYSFVGLPGDPKVMGILGFDLFRDYLLTLDYPAQRLRLAKGRLPRPADNGVIAYDSGSGSPVIRVRIGKREKRLMIDTGYPGGLSLPGDLKQTFATVDPPRHCGFVSSVNDSGRLRVWCAELVDTVEIAGVAFERPEVAFFEGHRQGFVGKNVLAGHAVTFDQRRRRVHFGPSGR